MKILLVTDAYNHLTNGVAIVVKTLSQTFREKGHDVKVLTMSNTREAARDDEVYFMPSFSVPLYPELRMSAVRRHPFLEELKDWKPDIIHIHSEASASRMAKAIAKETGAPVVTTWHTDYAKFAFHNHYSMSAIRHTAHLLLTAICRDTEIITVPSYKAKKILDGYALKYPNTVIPNGIILSRFQQEVTEEEREELLNELCIEKDKKILVIISRLSPEKNISELLEFFPELLKEEPNLHLLIAGIGPDKKHLEELSEKLGIKDNVTFAGFVPPELTYRYYKLGMAFMSASTFEMHSLTYLEAMACGLPLICRSDPSLQGVLDDGQNGYIYKTREEFVEKALRLIQDDDLRQKMAACALERSLEFSEEAFADNMLELYEDIVRQGKTTATKSKGVKKKKSRETEE